MYRRLAAKLSFCVLIVVVLIEGTWALISIKLQRDQLLDNMVQGADQLSRSITSATWQAMLADHHSAAYAIMETIAAKQGIDRIRIFNKEGLITFSTGSDQGTMVDEHAEACFLCHAEKQPLVRVSTPSRARIFEGEGKSRKMGVITPFYNEPACSNAACHAHSPEKKVLGVLDVNLSLGQMDEDLAAIRNRAVFALCLEILLLAAIVAYFTRRFVHRPIQKLIDGTKAVSAMQLDQPIHAASSDEIGELGRSFDVMRERLRASVARNEEFTHGLESMVQERTEQLRKAQENMLQSDRLVSLGQLAASVAHEINNPLSGVLNLSMLMQRLLREDGIPPGRIDDFRSYLSQIVNETSRAGRIVTDLLAFSRHSKPQHGESDLNDIVRYTASLVGHQLDLSGVRLELNLEEGLPRLSCDGSQIQQVLVNLFLNAAESIQDAGVIRAKTRTAPGGAGIELEVTDTGEGMTPEVRRRIFDPFFTTKEAGKGVGLGLAVVYGIVRSHAGEIEVESEVGVGTTFRINLPLSAPDSAPTNTAPDSTVQERA